MEYTTEQRRAIADKLNECGFVAMVNGKKKLAHLCGIKLNFPIVVTQDKENNTEISWQLADRLARGIVNHVQF